MMHSPSFKTRFLTAAMSVALLLGAEGCARTPSGVSNNNGPQLVVTMQMAGPINPSYFYFVMFNVYTGVAPLGPVPQIGPNAGQSWYNGFAAGQFTAFMEYNGSQANTGYQMWAAVPTSNGTPSQTFTPLPAPVQFTPVASEPNQNILQFQIPISELATSTIPANQITSVQMNMIAQNVLPTDANSQTKAFDALGDPRQANGLNEPFTFATTQSATYNNSSSVVPPAQEPSGDVFDTGPGVYSQDPRSDADPTYAAVDIVNWQVQVVD